MITQTISETRENLSDLLGKVQHGGENVTILKHGKPVAVIVSIEDLAFLESAEDAYWSRRVAEIEADPAYDPNDTVPAAEVFARLLANPDLE
jgi:prevent-host-death family protein